MTQEDKELLLKDLCGRLPYGVKCLYYWKKPANNETIGYIGEFDSFHLEQIECMDDFEDVPINDFKPYLRPMSSITDEEKKEYGKVCELDTEILVNHPMNGGPFPALYNSQDWLNSHHFDYRGLIEKCLALEAPKGMYDFKQ